MIEAYAFLAAFAIQILALSVLIPSRFIGYVRGWMTSYASERFAQLYPDFDYGKWAVHFATRYRAVNVVIALLGVALLGWLFTLIWHPDWINEVTRLTIVYFFLQMSPMILLGLYTVRHHKLLLHPPQEGRRKAILQRRGLTDFVPPWVVAFAVASYFLFVVFAIWLDLHVYKNTSLSKQCFIAIGSVTLGYAVNALTIYRTVYGRKNPVMTNEGRAQMMRLRVKGCVYGSIAVAWFIALMVTLRQADLREWAPLALSAFLVISSLLGFTELKLRKPQEPESQGHASISS